jgi:hypothetical protein
MVILGVWELYRTLPALDDIYTSTELMTTVSVCTWCAIGFLLHILALIHRGAKYSPNIQKFG